MSAGTDQLFRGLQAQTVCLVPDSGKSINCCCRWHPKCSHGSKLGPPKGKLTYSEVCRRVQDLLFEFVTPSNFG